MAELQRLLEPNTCSPFSDLDARAGEPDPVATDTTRPSGTWAVRVDTRLLDDCVQGDAIAWRQLHRLCYPRAAAFLRKLGVSDLDLDDAAQEVFVQLFRYLPSFRREAELSTWLFRVCITQARSVRRRKRLTQTLSRVLALASSASLVSTPSLSDEVVRQRVEAALASLSDGDRSVFVLYEMEGVPGKRIAEILTVPEATVWRRLHGARQVFRRAIVGEDDPKQPRT